jgi:hypothetical protein
MMDTVAQEGAVTIAGDFGVCATVFVVTAIAASLIVPLKVLWLRVAVRVAGSWLAALGLRLVGLATHAK